MRTCVCGCQAERSARLLAAARRAFTFFLADGDAVSDGGRVRDIRRTATPPPSSCSCSISSISTARISARGRGSSARRSLPRTALSSKIIACRPAQSAVLPMTRLRRIPPCVIMRSTAAGRDPRLVPVSRDGCRRGPVQRSWRKDGHYHGSDQSCPLRVKSGCPLDLDWWHQQHHAVPARVPDGEPWRAARSRSGEPGRGRFS